MQVAKILRKKNPLKTVKSSQKSLKKSAAAFLLPDNYNFSTVAEKVNISNKSGKIIDIRLVDNPLDVYSSPHLLNLSQVRFIEKVRPVARNSDAVSYERLPARNVLSQLNLLWLFDFSSSEILKFFSVWPTRVVGLIGRPWQQIDFSPQLPLARGQKRLVSEQAVLAWQEVTLVNFFMVIFFGLQKIWLNFYSFGYYILMLLKVVGRWRDEEINFTANSRPKAASQVYTWSSKTAVKKITKLATTDKKTAPAVKKRWFIFSWPTRVAAPLAKEEKIARLALPKKSFSEKFSFFWPVALWRLSLKSVGVFFLLALLVALPLKSFTYWQKVQQVKGLVLGESEMALSDLKQAQNELLAFNFQAAGNYFSSANQNFVSAHNQLGEIKSILTLTAQYLPHSILKSGQNLLALGDNLSSAGEHLTTGLNFLTASSTQPLTDKIKSFSQENKIVIAKLEAAQDNLRRLDLRRLPEDNRGQLVKFKDKLPSLIGGLKELQDLADWSVAFLGDAGLRRYLVIFQNDNELRASGGFMGSFALVDLEKGKIKNLELPAGGTYDVRAGFNELLAPPPALQMVNTRWEFQDANWWPDWSRSAKKIAWFYNKSGGPTVDGVIAINSDWLGQLLEVVGNIKLPGYNKTITAVNFEREIQKNIEIENPDRAKPKAILGELSAQLMQRLFSLEPQDLPQLLAVLSQGLKEKDILVNLSDERLQKLVVAKRWDGGLRQSEKDYLQVVSTNIGGGKTDSVIRQKIYHQANILLDGSVFNQVLISRHHFGPIDADFTTQTNRSYLRFYVPSGSQLLAANGFSWPRESGQRKPESYLHSDSDLVAEETALIDADSQTRIYEESGKTVFANWADLKPGQSQELLLVYKLPFKINPQINAVPQNLAGRLAAAFAPPVNYDSYSLLVQKQPGSGDDELISRVVYPENFILNNTYPALDKETDSAGFSGRLTGDLFYLVGLKEK